jgi:hypothetical protein
VQAAIVATTTLNQVLRFLQFVALLSLTGPVLAQQPQAGFTLDYELHARGLVIGRTQITLARNPQGRYVYQSNSAAVGVAALLRDDSVVERSEFDMRDGKLVSRRYNYERISRKRPRTVMVEFDWLSNEAHNTAKGRTWSMVIEPGTLDKLNYVLVLMDDLSRDQHTLNYAVADGGKLKTFHLDYVGKETIDTVHGPLDTVVVRRKRKNRKRVTTLWCAAKFGFAPVKIEHSEPDGNLSLLLTSATGNVRGIPGLRQP